MLFITAQKARARPKDLLGAGADLPKLDKKLKLRPKSILAVGELPSS